jgi:hypothetical protein
MAATTKYPEPKEDDDVLLRLREDYGQAVLDLFGTDQNTKGIRPVLDVAGYTSNFLDNMRLPIHRWFRYSAGFSAEWVKWLLAERNDRELRVLDPYVVGVQHGRLSENPKVYSKSNSSRSKQFFSK